MTREEAKKAMNGGRTLEELYEVAMKDIEAHPNNYNDIFEGYENNLDKAVALIEWQKQEIESLTIRMNAYGLAVKRLAEERGKYFLHKENGEVVPLVKQSEGEWISNCQTDEFICSLCGAIAPVDCLKEEFYKSKFCPNCGAKMKGGAK